MTYQAVIRNASNNLVVNLPVKMKISILQGSASGTAVYSELHNPTTNANGLVALEIGGGTSPVGTIEGIDWGNGIYFLKTETDPTNGTNYTIVGTTQLLSVPYALHANCVPSSISGTNDTLSIGCKKIVFPIYVDSTRHNWGIGFNLFNSNTTGNSNLAIGRNSLKLNTTGGLNTVLGHISLRSNTTGFSNTAIGSSSMFDNTVGYQNTAIGVGSLGKNISGYNNTSVGVLSLNQNTTGSRNVAVGTQALQKNTTGDVNNAFGYLALTNNTTASANNAFGHQALEQNTIGEGNAGFGHNVLQFNTSGNGNTAIGYTSLQSIVNGSYNTGLGFGAGSSILGSNNTFIGAYSAATNANVTNATAIGYNARVSNSNSMVLGGTGADAVNVGIGIAAPARTLHVNAVMRLEPIPSPPANPSKGDMYFDSTINKLRVYDGTVWQNLW
jgi:hypothetical protein